MKKFSEKYIQEHDLLLAEFYLRGVMPYCSYLAKKRIDSCVIVGD